MNGSDATAALPTRRPWVGQAALLTAAGLWALIGVYTRELADLGIDALSVGAWRAVLGGACFMAHFAVQRSRRPTSSTTVSRRELWALVTFALVGVTLFFAALPLAIETGDITVAFVLLYTAPAWVTLGAWLLLRERVTRLQFALVGVTVLGAALVSVGGAELRPTAASVFWGLVAGLSYSSYYLLGRRLFERHGPVLVYAVCLPLGALPLVGLVAATGDLAWPSPKAWLLLLGLGVGSTWAPFVLLSIGLEQLPSSRAVITATVEPVIAALIAASFYDERLATSAWIGAALILVAATLSATRR